MGEHNIDIEFVGNPTFKLEHFDLYYNGITQILTFRTNDIVLTLKLDSSQIKTLASIFTYADTFFSEKDAEKRAQIISGAKEIGDY